VSRRVPYRQPAVVWVLSVVIVVMLLAGGWQVIEQGASGYYAFAPGSAPLITINPQCRASNSGQLVLPDGTPCARLIVPADRAHPIQGALHMVDVLVGPSTPGQYVLSKLGLLHTVESGTQLVPADAVLGTTPPAQLACQNAQQMVSATSSAQVVALRQLGYQVKEEDLGAQLVEVLPGSPAATAGLHCNDLVIKVNAAVIHTAGDFVAAVHVAKPGETVHLTVRRTGTNGKFQTLTLSPTLSGTPALGGRPPAPDEPFLGVASTTQTIFVFPFDVNIEVGNIGGPSAGLALTLGLLDVLSAGNLTGGHRIAATGTINLDGTVGDVGGVAQKAVAVRQAGAQVFFVPPQELKAAESQAGSMKVLAVSSLQQALDDLKAMGGHIPTPASGT
jgi:PDZ domain-containing protein